MATPEGYAHNHMGEKTTSSGAPSSKGILQSGRKSREKSAARPDAPTSHVDPNPMSGEVHPHPEGPPPDPPPPKSKGPTTSQSQAKPAPYAGVSKAAKARGAGPVERSALIARLAHEKMLKARERMLKARLSDLPSEKHEAMGEHFDRWAKAITPFLDAHGNPSLTPEHVFRPPPERSDDYMARIAYGDSYIPGRTFSFRLLRSSPPSMNTLRRFPPSDLVRDHLFVGREISKHPLEPHLRGISDAALDGLSSNKEAVKAHMQVMADRLEEMGHPDAEHVRNAASSFGGGGKPQQYAGLMKKAKAEGKSKGERLRTLSELANAKSRSSFGKSLDADAVLIADDILKGRRVVGGSLPIDLSRGEGLHSSASPGERATFDVITKGYIPTKKDITKARRDYATHEDLSRSMSRKSDILGDQASDLGYQGGTSYDCGVCEDDVPPPGYDNFVQHFEYLVKNDPKFAAFVRHFAVKDGKVVKDKTVAVGPRGEEPEEYAGVSKAAKERGAGPIERAALVARLANEKMKTARDKMSGSRMLGQTALSDKHEAMGEHFQKRAKAITPFLDAHGEPSLTPDYAFVRNDYSTLGGDAEIPIKGRREKVVIQTESGPRAVARTMSDHEGDLGFLSSAISDHQLTPHLGALRDRVSDTHASHREKMMRGKRGDVSLVDMHMAPDADIRDAVRSDLMVMSDRMEEHGHPHAERIRGLAGLNFQAKDGPEKYAGVMKAMKGRPRGERLRALSDLARRKSALLADRYFDLDDLAKASELASTGGIGRIGPELINSTRLAMSRGEDVGGYISKAVQIADSGKAPRPSEAPTRAELSELARRQTRSHVRSLKLGNDATELGYSSVTGPEKYAGVMKAMKGQPRAARLRALADLADSKEADLFIRRSKARDVSDLLSRASLVRENPEIAPESLRRMAAAGIELPSESAYGIGLQSSSKIPVDEARAKLAVLSNRLNNARGRQSRIGDAIVKSNLSDLGYSESPILTPDEAANAIAYALFEDSPVISPSVIDPSSRIADMIYRKLSKG